VLGLNAGTGVDAATYDGARKSFVMGISCFP